MRVNTLSFSYSDQAILDNLSFEIKNQKVTTILGENGAGKSTLFSLLTKNLKPSQGEIYLDERDISQIKLREFASAVAIVHQHNTAPPDITVKRLVAYGRAPYLKKFRGATVEDDKAIKWAMDVTGISGFQDKLFSNLSGGQKQRVWLAMALAQKPKILFLDEPTTFLDLRYQIEMLLLIQELNTKHGMTIVMVLHDVNHALSFSDEVIGLKDGKVVVTGKPEEVVTSEMIDLLYGIKLEIVEINHKKVVLNQRMDEGAKEKEKI